MRRKCHARTFPSICQNNSIKKEAQIKNKAEKLARYLGRSKAGEGLKIIKDDFLAEELRVSRV